MKHARITFVDGEIADVAYDEGTVQDNWVAFMWREGNEEHVLSYPIARIKELKVVESIDT